MSFRRLNLACALLLGSAFASAQTTQPAATLPDPPAVSSQPGYAPITGRQRLSWFVRSTVGPESLAGGLFSAGIGTARDKPVEYGPHWDGFGSRYGMRLTGVATGNAMEAGLGALWGEDPRYFPAPQGTAIRGRIGHVVLMTFAARRSQGQLAPAYARFIADPGNNFLSNAWRADSEATARDAAMRSMWGILGRMGGNAFKEFWPSVSKRIFHRGQD
ncbi:MAG TPA: hypothetical protein VMH85_22475 [Terriglobales bacterium]|nr:hypothetical protein [Terriglobales bacterium]